MTGKEYQLLVKSDETKVIFLFEIKYKLGSTKRISSIMGRSLKIKRKSCQLDEATFEEKAEPFEGIFFFSAICSH